MAFDDSLEPTKPWQLMRKWFYGGPPSNCTMFGQFGKNCVGHGDMAYMEQLLTEHQEWTTVLELGTGSGLTTLWYAVAMNLRNGVVWTWDQTRPQPFYARNWPHGVIFKQGDLYSEPLISQIKDLASKTDTLLICDGGLKTLEFQTYAPSLAKGNGIVCHDWAVEVDHDLVERVARDLGLEPLLHQWAGVCLSRYRGWKKV